MYIQIGAVSFPIRVFSLLYIINSLIPAMAKETGLLFLATRALG